MFWFLLVAGFAFLHRAKPALESLLLYTGVMVAASPAIFPEYLSIPCAFTAVFVNYFTVFYTLVAALHLAAHPGGPHLLPAEIGARAGGAIGVLACALVWITWQRELLRLRFPESWRREFHFQLGLKEKAGGPSGRNTNPMR